MRCLDVNVLVYAMRQDTEQHSAYRGWLQDALLDPSGIGIPAPVLAGTARITTNSRIWRHPSSSQQVLEFLDAVCACSTVRVLSVSTRTWDVCAGLIREISARGNEISDALLAASAIEHGATFVTADRGFRRFPGLRVHHPLDP
jgi:hypothetical protein